MHIFWARLAGFCHLGFISDPLIVSKFHNETHDPKGQEKKIYTIVKGRRVKDVFEYILESEHEPQNKHDQSAESGFDNILSNAVHENFVCDNRSNA